MWSWQRFPAQRRWIVAVVMAAPAVLAVFLKRRSEAHPESDDDQRRNKVEDALSKHDDQVDAETGARLDAVRQEAKQDLGAEFSEGDHQKASEFIRELVDEAQGPGRRGQS
ncbi:MAG: hypothetical protein AAFN74_05250 [Myxococcota bacterium]